MPEDPLAPLSGEAIQRTLKGRAIGPFGQPIHYRPQGGSTNDIAAELARTGAPQGTLVITDEQTAGRGRMGRRWTAPPNTALLLSLVFRPDLPPDEANRLVMTVGLAAAEAIETRTGLRVDVKWPNDLLVVGAKVAGILAESGVVEGRLDYVVVGIGINVNLRDDPVETLLYPATSLLHELGRPVDRLALLADLLERLNHWHGLLAESQLDEAWQARMVTLGQRVSVRLPSGTVSGLAERVDRSGALWLRPDAGEPVRLAAGEVTLR